MAGAYSIKFYNPYHANGIANAAKAIQVLCERGGVILSYQRNFKGIKVESGYPIVPANLVDPVRGCGVRMCFNRPGVNWLIFFQVNSPDVKGAQSTISMEEDEFESDPDLAGKFLLNLAEPLLRVLDMEFAWGDHELMLERLEANLTFERIGALAWANLFSAHFVQHLDNARLSSMPASKALWLEQSLLLLTAPEATTVTSPSLVRQINACWPGCQVREYH